MNKKLRFTASLVAIFLLLASHSYAAVTTVYSDDLETDQGWMVNPNATDTATTGLWEIADPEQTTGGQRGDTVSGTQALVTDGRNSMAGNGTYDVDGGVTSIRSPAIDLPGLNPGESIELSFWYYLAHLNNATADDYLRVTLLGATTNTVVLEELGASHNDSGIWSLRVSNLDAYAGETVHLLIEVADEATASLIEAGIDDVAITVFTPAVFAEDFSTDQGWVINALGTDTAATGQWARGIPEATYDTGDKQLSLVAAGSEALVTGLLAGASAGDHDVDGGVTSVRSPDIALPTLSAGESLELSLAYYLAHNNASSTSDYLRVTVKGSVDQLVLEEKGINNFDNGAWLLYSGLLDSFAGETIHLLIEAEDASSDSLVEAAIDHVAIRKTNPPLDFTQFTIDPYVVAEDLSGGAVVEDGGSSLRVTANAWKKIDLPYTVTVDTVLEFDFSSAVEGEIHGIGMAANQNFDLAKVFKLHGTQAGGNQTYDTYPGDGSVAHFVIPIGQHYTGAMQHLFFVMDNDAAAQGDSVFSHVRVYEQAAAPVAPQITSTAGTTATVDAAYEYDADNTVEATGTAPISFSLTSGPTGMTVSSAGLVSWTPSAAQVGTHSVQITASNSVGSTPQTFDVTVSAAPVTEIIIDNLDANTSSTSTWLVSTATGAWGSNSVYDDGGDTFRWTPTITTAGTYDVYAWWTYHVNRITNVPYYISHADGTAVVTVNQKDQALAGQWVLLGTYDFNAGSSHYIEVSSENGQASADAVRWVVSPRPAVDITAPADGSSFTLGDNVIFSGTAIDQQDGDISSGLVWESNVQSTLGNGASLSLTTLQQGTHLITAKSIDSDTNEGTASISITINPPTSVPPQITSAAGTAATEGVPYVYDADNTVEATGTAPITFSLTSGPTGMTVSSAGLVSWTPSAGQVGTHSVEITASNSVGSTPQTFDVTVSGAPVTEIIIDNLDANTSSTSTWLVSTATGAWGSNSVYDDGGDTFRWTPTITTAGTYDVYAWWTYHANRITNVPYYISHADGTAVVTVNQKDQALAGQWVLLGTYDFNAGSSHYIEVSSENGQASADAVRWVVSPRPAVDITAPADGSSFTLGDNVTFSGTAIDQQDGDISSGLAWESSLDSTLGNSASLSVTTLQQGTHLITAKSIDSDTNEGTASISITINPPTSVPPQITSAAGTAATEGVPYVYDADNTVEATGTAPITFSLTSGPTGMEVSSAGVVSWTPTLAQVGNQAVQITATNTAGDDDQIFNVTVSAAPQNAPPTVDITSPTDGSTFDVGSPITINADATDTDGNVTLVEFFRNGIPLAEDSTAPYGLTWLTAPVGNHALTAKATDDSGNTSESAAVNITVNSTLPAATLVSPAGNVSFNRGDNICFSWNPVPGSNITYSVEVSETSHFAQNQQGFYLSPVWNYGQNASNGNNGTTVTEVCWNQGAGWEKTAGNNVEVPSSFTPDRNYFWRVIAFEGHAGSYTTLSRSGARPFAFTDFHNKATLLSPAPAAEHVVGDNLCFSWEPVAGNNINYVVQVSETGHFEQNQSLQYISPVYTYGGLGIATTQACWDQGVGWQHAQGSPLPSADFFTAGKEYFWRVIAFEDNIATPVGMSFSDSRSFNASIGTTSLLTPVTDTNFELGENVCFTWDAVEGNSVTYVLQVSQGGDFVPIEPVGFTTPTWSMLYLTAPQACWDQGAGWESVLAPVVPPPATLVEGDYYWRVFAYEGNVASSLDSSLSESSSFNVIAPIGPNPSYTIADDITVVTGVGQSPNVDIYISNPPDALNPATKYKLEWWPEAHWSDVKNSGFKMFQGTQHFHFLIQGEAALDSYSAQIKGYIFDTVVYESEIFQLAVNENSQYSINFNSAYEQGPVPTGQTIDTPLAPQGVHSVSSSLISASDQVGAVAGSFRVDESGSATYNIPIATAAGTAGVAPQISLGYSSQGGNGLLGKGWNIGGLSSISRCRQTLQQDGDAMPITWSHEDRFCLDGQRLIVQGAASYGDVGATYKTEIDSFAKITSVGGTQGHPDHFIVERKDGSVSEYGNSADSTLQAGNTNNVLTWALSRFADSVGNPIRFVYDTTNSASGSEQRIDKIYYAFGIDTSGATSRTYLEFSYQDRGNAGEAASVYDPIQGYIAGYLFKTTKRLETVTSYNEATGGALLPIRTYTLEYLDKPTGADANKTSKLASIEECRGGTCLPATTFDWAMDITGIGAEETDSLAIAAGGKDHLFAHRPLDINGDGVLDLAHLQIFGCTGSGCREPSLHYALSNGGLLTKETFTDSSPQVNFGDAGGNFEDTRLEVIDYNADGRQDVLIYDRAASQWKVFLATPAGSGWKLSATPIVLPFSNKDALFADLNSDGLVDAYYQTSPLFGGRNYTVHLMEPDPSAGVTIASNQYYRFDTGNTLDLPDHLNGAASSSATIAHPRSAGADFNGDGMTDLVVYYRYASGPEQKPVALVRNASGGYSVYAENIFPDRLVTEEVYSNQFLDINGDGLTDIVYVTGIAVGGHPRPEWRIRINNGNGFEAAQSILIGRVTPSENNLYAAGNKHYAQFFDYNQDGLPDFAWRDRDTNQLKIKLWDVATQNYDAEMVLRSTSDDDDETHAFMDLSGDGVTDYFRYVDERFYRAIGHGQDQVRNVITKITNGLGAETDISYGSLSNSGHYNRLEMETTTETYTGPCFDYYGGIFNSLPGSCDPYEVAHPDAFYSALNGEWELPNGSHTFGKGTGPVFELNAPIYVVTQAASSAPTGTNASAKSAIGYYYGEAKLQASGRGFLGFQNITSVDQQTGIKTTTRYRQDFPFVGYPDRTVVVRGDEVLSKSTNVWHLQGWDGISANPAAPYRPFIKTSVEETYHTASSHLNPGLTVGGLLQKVTTQNTYDDAGNPLTIDVTTTNGTGTESFVKNTTNQYGVDDYYKEKGRLTHTSVEFIRNGSTPEIRTSAFEYYDTGIHKGLLKKEIIEPLNPAYELTTTYDYDGFGNKTKATQNGAGVIARFTEWFYDPDGRYVNQTKNALGQVTETVLARNEYGAPTQVANIDGVISEIYYSVLGREYLRYTVTGGFTQTLSALCNPCDGVANSAYRVNTLQAGGAWSTEYFDVLGRSVRVRSLGFDGSPAYQDTEYDSLGRVTRVSNPSFSAIPSQWTTNSYDLLGRVVQTLLPDGSVNRIAYDGLSTTYTNDKGQDKTERKNVYGELKEVIDNHNGRITYSYDAQGNLLQLVADAGNDGVASGASGTITTDFTYDLLGRKKTMTDPDKGHWQYNYNVFGELTSQTDAKNQTRIISYDVLGRQLNRIDRQADSSIEGNTTWTYNNDLIGTGLGQLDQVADSESGYVKAVIYDNLGRPSETITFLGASPNQTQHFEKVTYDQFGRTFQVFDSARDGSDYSDNAIQYRYNTRGYLTDVFDAVRIDDVPRTTYYTVVEMDARGNVTEELLGNGYKTTRTYDPVTGRLTHIGAGLGGAINTIQDIAYEWDTLGNLERRRSLSGSKDVDETFSYDGLNRLTQSQVVGGYRTDLEYDSFGNIKSKNTYNGTGAINSAASVGTYTYGAGNAGPHAVTHTSIGNKTYSYDANGSMEGDGSRTITYSTFDKPLSITKGSHVTSFEYGPDRARYRRVDNANGDMTTTLYIGNVEKITRPDGTKEVKRYINGVAIVTQSYNTGGQLTGTEEQYLYKDHLGSIDFITNDLGGIVQEMSFDSWGKRRNEVDWSALTISMLELFPRANTTRGFTGHEMLDEVGLIHMNGRIYDPHLGRFMQADPFVQFADNTQSLNRYSYTFNNPLAYTDPSGYFIKELFDVIISIVNLFNPQTGGFFNLQNWINLIFDVINLVDAISASNSGSAFSNSTFVGRTSGARGSFNRRIQGGGSTGVIGESNSGTYRKTLAGTGSNITGHKFSNGAESNSFALSFNDSFITDPEGLLNDIEIADIIDKIDRLEKSLDLIADWDRDSRKGIQSTIIYYRDRMYRMACAKYVDCPLERVVIEDILIPVLKAGRFSRVLPNTTQGVWKSVDDLIKNSSNARKRAGRQKFDRQGGFDQANKDFDSLGPKGVKNIETKFGPGRTGTLSDGRTVVVRPGSSGGPATLEVQSGGNSIKFRFPE